MPTINSVHLGTAGVVGLFYLVTGIVELYKWRAAIPLFVNWGYPPYWPLVTYAGKVAAGLLVFIPGLQIFGLALALSIVVTGVATLLYRGDPMAKQAGPVGIVVAACIITAYLTG